MPRYIDADALLKHEIEADRMGAMLVVGKGYILSAPEVDAVPVVRGEWIVDECDTSDDVPSYSWIDFHCSECNTNYGLEEGQHSWCRYEKIPYNYCPNCGAKMGGKDGNSK